ncbi:MAG: C1 family peptidase, partial [Thermoplasmatota archaeon]
MVMPDMYGANYYLFRDHFENFGWNITLAGLTASVRACPAYASPLGCPRITVDVLVSDISDITTYHAICIVSATKWTGVSPCQDLLGSQDLLDLISYASENDIVIAAWCNAVRVLAAADVLDGKEVTGASEYKNEYTAAGATFLGGGVYPVIDGNIVTATAGQSYSLEACESVALAIERSQRNDVVHREYPVQSHPGIDDEHVLWSHALGSSANDGARSAYHTQDKGYILSGYTYQSGPHNADVLLIKTNEDGDIQWSNTYGGDGREYGNSCIQTQDGTYIVVGYSTSYGSHEINKDAYIAKIDSAGTLIWERHFGGDDEDEATSVCETASGDYLICGYTKSFGAGDNDVYIIRMNTDGHEQWNITVGGSNSDRGSSIIPTSDGNYVIVGATGSFGAGLRDYLLIKISPTGEVLCRNIYGQQQNYEWALSVCETEDNGFLLVGYCDVLFEELLDVYIVKTDANGNYAWEQRYGEGTFYDYGTSVVRQDDSYIITGVSKSKLHSNDIYLLSIDQTGNKIFSQKISGNNNDWANTIISTDNQNLIIAGQTNSNDEGQFDMMLTKMSLLDNTAPLTPEQPNGQTHVKKGKTYSYSSTSTDAEQDAIYYLFDWGDDTFSDWLGPYFSNDICTAQHSWNENSSKNIRVKAKDEHDFHSAWSEPLVITLPKDKDIISHIRDIIDDLIERMFTAKNPNMIHALERIIPSQKTTTYPIQCTVMTDPMVIPTIDDMEKEPASQSVELPSSFSWKNHLGSDWTTTAKQQGNCGSCWDFAAVGTLECMINIQNGDPDIDMDLSEQYILSCLPAAANNYGEGCLGGNPYNAFYCLKDDGDEGNNCNGIISEACFSYMARDDVPCDEKCEDWHDELIPIRDCGFKWPGFDSPKTRDIIKTKIFEQGPVAAGMDCTTDFINWGATHHQSNEYYPYEEQPWNNILNHLIIIVGWNDDVNIPQGGYWIC